MTRLQVANVVLLVNLISLGVTAYSLYRLRRIRQMYLGLVANYQRLIADFEAALAAMKRVYEREEEE